MWQNTPNAWSDSETESVKKSTWLALPEKSQITLIFTSRLFDFVQITAIQSYIFDQLKSFNNPPSDSKVSRQVGLLYGGYTAAQAVTALLWGRLSDLPWVGRKPVFLIGLLGSASACLGVAFSRTFSQALAFRIIGGAVNGNGGISIAMIAEVLEPVREMYLPEGFLLLPLSFNFAVFLGPLLGGFLSDPIATFPWLFGPGSVIGGRSGVEWMKNFPYALPALVLAVMLVSCALVGLLLLNETIGSGQRMSSGSLLSPFRSDDSYDSEVSNSQLHSSILTGKEGALLDRSLLITSSHCSMESYHIPENLVSKGATRLARTETKRLLTILITQAIFDLHMSAFSCVWILFLCAPRPMNDRTAAGKKNFVLFSGGLGLSTRQAGLATSMIGLAGVPLQLFFYPWTHKHLGTLRSYRLFSGFFLLAYFLMPFVTLAEPNNSGTRLLTWILLGFVLILHTIGRVVAVPATISLLNDSAPNASLLGFVNGVGQSVSAAFRTLGPIIGAYLWACGLENELAGATWWILAMVTFTGTILISSL